MIRANVLWPNKILLYLSNCTSIKRVKRKGKSFIRVTGNCFQTKLSILWKFLDWDLALSTDLKVVCSACIINAIDLLMMLPLYLFKPIRDQRD